MNATLQEKNGTAGKAAGQSRGWAVFLKIILLAALDTAVVELFNHKCFTEGFAKLVQFVTGHPLALAVNFLLILVTLAPAMFLRRRTFWLVTFSCIWVIVGAVNGFIRINRLTPFTTADMTVLNTGLDTLPNYMSKGYIILLGVAIFAVLAAWVWLFGWGPKNAVRLGKRLVTGVICTGLTVASLVGCWVMAYRTNQLSDIFANLAIAYDDYGFSFCFLETWLEKGIRRPVGYSEEQVNELQQHIKAATVDARKDAGNENNDAMTDVNVVFVQLESFIDPGEVTTLKLSEDAVPNWTRLKENYSHGYLQVPVVGAGTANTECEVLTGMNTQMFGPGEYPYKTCLLDNTVESVAYNLKNLGYGTHAIHNHRAAFYGRNYVYANLGFDDFTALEYMPKYQKTPKNWCKDAILTEQIFDALQSTPEQPDLVFTVSVQGHGSYPSEQLIQDPAIKVLSCGENVEKYAVEYYVNQVHEMDEFIGQLTDMLANRDEKTVLVLYGDHLPSLDLTRDEMRSGSLFRTEYVIWDNFGLAKKTENLTSYRLAAVTLERLNIIGGNMCRFQQNCYGDLNYEQELRLIQYDTLFGKNYLNGGNSPYEATVMKMGLQPIAVNSLRQGVDGYWYLYGKNFTPFCKATVGENILSTKYISGTCLRIKEDPGTDRAEDIYITVLDKHKEVLGTSLEQ